jgi:putative ABC transport system permease protein
MHVSLSGVIYNGDKIANDYYEKQNIADYWITGIGLDRKDCNKLQNIKGVTQLQPRTIIDAEDRYDDSVSLILYGIAGGYNINTPLIMEGTYPADSREIMISSAFAEKRGLHIGDTYEMKIKSTGQILRKKICALIKSPECMYHINETSLMPDFSKYGFAYMDEKALAEVFGENIYTQICIKTEKNAKEAEIKSAINAALGNKLINTLALKDNISAYNLTKQIDGLRGVITIFPFLFFLVAILIMSSTMSRLIENSRQSIGTLKALGYYDRSIVWYYLLYAILVVLIAFVIGILPATELITKPIANTLFFSLDLPVYKLLPDKSAWVYSFVLTCISCIGTAFVIAVKALKEKPTECMRPKPPKKVKKIIFEKFPILWSKLNFSQKYIIRNILRNKTRMMICVIGIAGCMTLILTSFAIRDSVNNYLATLVSNEHQYDYLINFDRSITKVQFNRIALMDSTTDTQYEMIANAKIYSKDKMEAIRFTVTEDVIRLKMPETYGPSPFILPEDGIIMEKDTADKLGIKEGDVVTVKFAGKNKYYHIPIVRVSSNITGVYASKSYWRNLGEEYTPTSVYVKVSDANAFANQISNYDFILSSKTRDEVTEVIINQMSSLSMIVFILIIFGGILALIVLYNLGIMSFYEQIRNLATLLVLGFHDKEARKLLLTENIIFTAIGIIGGIPLGIFLGALILSSVSIVTMELSITPLSYTLSIIITMSFAILVNKILGNKMKSIDMLGALKSVE